MNYYDYLTEFIFVEDVPKPSDVIFIPGSRYGELAERAAELYHQGMAPVLIPSGKYSVLEKGLGETLSPKQYAGRQYDTESDFFTAVLMEHGVPASAIWQEKEATFTYENAIFSRKVLEEKGAYSEQRDFRAILVCQAYHARRCLLYYSLVFPGTRFFVCPVPTRETNRNNWYQEAEKIDLVLGEVERCGSQFHAIMKGTDQVWKGRK